jgi:hypothetical protein
MPFSGTAYDPETLALMTAAFEAAWSEAQAKNLTTDPPNIARTSMASTILVAVNNGERDPQRLREVALKTLNGSGRY